MKTPRYLFVCLGNICRSPVAEGLMRHHANALNINIETDSAGTNSYHTNEPPDKRSQTNALKHHVSISDLRARTFKSSDFDNFDFIYVMDESNYNNVITMADTDVQKQKVKLILAEISNCKYKSVPDPYYGNENDFELVFQLLNDATLNICKKIKTL